MPRLDSTLLYNVVRFARFRVYSLVLGRRLTAGPRGLLGRRASLQVRPGGRLTVGEHFVTGDDVLVAASGELRIGDDVFVNRGSRIVAHESVIIGDHVVIAAGVSVLDHDHRTSTDDGRLHIHQAEFTTAPIRIGDNVWLGDKVTVLKGVTIGDNVIVGANAVVTSDVEAGTIVGGVPARLIRRLDLD